MKVLVGILCCIQTLTLVGQCIEQTGHQGEQLMNSASGLLISPNYRTNVVLGQPFISPPAYSATQSHASGYWNRLLVAPSIGTMSASDGDQPDRIVLQWELAPNTSNPTIGYKIYRDGIQLTTVSKEENTFLDYNVIPGVYYEYAITGVSQYGEGSKMYDVGYVNPNGIISGRVTTFAGNSVEGAIVSLSPSSNMSLQFDGTGGLFIDTIETNSSPLITNDFTVSFWMKPDSYTNGGVVLDYGKQESPSQNFWIEVGNDQSVTLGMADITGNKELKHIFTSNPNDWHHITGVYNGSEMILYIDGQVLSSIQVDSSNTNFTNHQIGIGALANKGDASDRFTGYIDDVRILNKVQRPSEIRTFMFNTLPKDYDGLVAYWKMDEGKGFKVANLAEIERPGYICEAAYSTVEPGVKSSGISNGSGYYLISDVNYGTGTTFTVKPQKYVSFNYALEFNQVESQYAVTPGFGMNDTGTLEMWFNPYVLHGTQYLLSANGPTQMDIYMEGNQLKLNLGGQVETIGTISSTNYHYLTLIKEGGNYTTYINSDLATAHSFTSSVSSAIGKTTWNLGVSSSLSNYYSGLIDNIVTWKEALDIPTMQTHNTLGVTNVMTEVDGFEVIDEKIDAFIGLNEATGSEIANDIQIGGGTEWGTVHGAGFTDITAHGDGIEHEFDPNSRIVTLNQSSTSTDGIDFTDISTVPVSGVFKYEKTNCYIETAEVLVDGESTFPPTFTDDEGKFTVDMEPGTSAHLSVKYQEHEIFPLLYEVRNIQTPKAGILFVDKTKRSVSGKVAGGLCEMLIVPALGTATVDLTSVDGCFNREIIIDDANTSGDFVFDDIPPLEFNVSITQHTLGFIKSYFDTEGGQTIDVKDSSQTEIDFIYFAPPQVELTSLDTNDCGDPMIQQSLKYFTNVKVYEEYLDKKCYLETADLTISDGIGEAAEDGFDGTTLMEDGQYKYNFYAGEANIVSPYTKSLQVVADVNGASSSASIEAVVLGQRKRESTFTTTTPEMPIAILRDPPGDGSSAFLEKTSDLCLAGMAFSSGSMTTASSQTVSVGKDITINTGVPGATQETEVDVTAETTSSASVGVSGGITYETSSCVSFAEVIATSDDLIGAEGDVYVGAAINILYGLSDNLRFDSATCSYNIYQELVMDHDGFETFYLYSQNHLLSDVIPTNYALGEIKSAESWESFIDLNNMAKENATLIENRSFDAGVSYETSRTIATDNAITADFSIDLTHTLEGETGVEADGVGVTFGNSMEVGFSFGGSVTSSVSNSRTFGFALSDDDIGDNFSINIKSDPYFGSPVFELVSGESSCPHEENTLPREGVQILVDNNKQSTKLNVSTDQAAIFPLYIGNTSQSDEEGTYAIDLVNTSNPFGAELSINGAPLVSTSGGSGITYTLQPSAGQFVTLALERGLDPNIYEYDSILVVFQSLCDDQISDTVMVSAHFVEPCSYINISDPKEDWVITPADSGLLSFVLDEYNETDPDLDLIRIQYREKGAPSWINITEIPKDSLGEVFSLYTWAFGDLKDGEYQVRAISVCTGGLPSGFSEVIAGKIEQEAPEIFGQPEPADGVLNPGDEISVTFTELINCGNIYYADEFNLNNIGLYNLTTSSLVNANVQCVDDKIVLTPLIPMIFLENQTLEVRITGIEDLVGNVMEPDVTGSPIHKWEFYVNVSPVAWVGTEVDEFMEVGNSHSFDRIIENTGGTNVDYTIELPSYLTATPNSGTLPAGGQLTVSFNVNNQLAIGDYNDELILKTSYGEEKLPVHLRVGCPPPLWSIDPSIYSFNMNFTVALDIEGEKSEDEYDLLAGYIDGQLRGVAPVQYVEALDKHLIFLSVYGNAIDNGKEVRFKVWDASACQIYEQTEESYPFATNGQIGTPISEEIIHTKELLSKTIQLHAGWNWISFNLKLEDSSLSSVMTPLSNPTNGLIKSQSQFGQYHIGSDTWVGNLGSVNEIEMYQLQLNNIDSLGFSGRSIDLDSSFIPIVVGWNWIGYLPQAGMPIDDALESLTPYNGDIIKNQYFFAQYVAGIGWIGNLSYMAPLSGYLYSSSIVDTVRFSSTSRREGGLQVESLVLEQMKDQETLRQTFKEMTLSPNDFNSNMNIIGLTFDKNKMIVEDGDQLFAYVDGEIRGLAEAKYVPHLNQYTFFLSIFGDADEQKKNIHFQYLQARSNTLYSIHEVLSYQANDIIGLIGREQSFTLGVAQVTGVNDLQELATNALSVYPNPTKGSAIIRYYAQKGGEIQLSIYDAVGKLITATTLQVSKGENEIEFGSLIPLDKQATGLYNITVQSENQVHRVKLLKE